MFFVVLSETFSHAIDWRPFSHRSRIIEKPIYDISITFEQLSSFLPSADPEASRRSHQPHCYQAFRATFQSTPSIMAEFHQHVLAQPNGLKRLSASRAPTTNGNKPAPDTNDNGGQDRPEDTPSQPTREVSNGHHSAQNHGRHASIASKPDQIPGQRPPKITRKPLYASVLESHTSQDLSQQDSDGKEDPVYNTILQR